jgi:uncharacterized protein YndB with AHSA1/START domain
MEQANILQTQRILPYSPDEIYAAFADPQQLAKWWGPAGFSNTIEAFDFSVGGEWRFIMHGPDGKNYPNTNVFRALEPGKKVVLEHIFVPHFTLTISLLAAEGGTRVVWVQEFDDEKTATAVSHIAGPGNEQNLDRLHALLSGG